MRTDERHRCIICLGSNCRENENLAKAEVRLADFLTDITWGEAIQTEAEGTAHKGWYVNRAASATTSLTLGELTRVFKQIERECGRTPDGKATDIIPLDIDILMYDGAEVKPDDLKKGYVRRALHSLNRRLLEKHVVEPA